MKILSWNVNGIRAIYKKGFLGWLEKSGGEIFCLQEIKAKEEQLPSDLINPQGYFSYFDSATRPGYAGVAIYTKKQPLKIEFRTGLDQFDQEGRILKFKYPDFTLINFYLPHGGRGKEKLDYKLAVYSHLLDYLGVLRKKQENLILIGDFNVAHQEIDLARPQQNKNNIMFTPEERKKIDELINLGFVDTFRRFNQEGGHYTWWPYFANARERNLGWRIDYVFVSESLVPKLEKAFILPTVIGSDHCPIGIQLTN